MKPRNLFIGLVFFLAVLTACDTTTHKARRMVKRAERLADTLPDSTVRLIDSVLRMPASFSERERMDMALLQAEALFSDHGQEISPIMDDDFFDDHANLSTSPELERAAAYYARKKQYGKAAHAALYSGFVQQHYNEKEAAMRSFKEAEEYGMLVTDSLTIARAQFKMGKMLYDDYAEGEALSLFKSSDRFLGCHDAERAFVLNLEALCYMVFGDYENAEFSLQQGLLLAKKSHFGRAKRKILNNRAVLFQLQGRYKEAISCHRQLATESNLGDKELLLLNKNIGSVFMKANEMDSATLYFKRVDSLLLVANVQDEIKISAYNALSSFAESQDDFALALQYRDKHDSILNQLREKIGKRAVYTIQRKYDYEFLQNTTSQKLVRKHRTIIALSLFAILGLAALAYSQIRLAKIRKQEINAKTNLFHFMQQNKELQQRQETNEKKMMDLSMASEANIKAFKDLTQKYQETQISCMNYAQKISDALNKEALVMRKLDIFLGNKTEKAYLAALNDAVFEGDDHWNALMKVFDELYPNVRKSIRLQYPELTDMEQKDFILSYFNVSREDEAVMFNKSVHMVDKWRSSVRKKMQKKENLKQKN